MNGEPDCWDEVEGMLSEDFAGRILPFDSAAAHAYAVIAAARRADGRPINHADCQIAAIARCPRSVSGNKRCR